jgi:AbrB family looped-hinge helix DNA binding protein
MSAKGTVVIPERIRKKMGLLYGSEFMVMEKKGTIIFKAVSEPDETSLKKLISNARTDAKRTGLKPDDVHQAVRRVRRRAR